MPQAPQLPLWNYQTVTERQVVLDSVQLLMGLETPTFEQVQTLDGCQAKTFKVRRPIQLLHLSPSALQTMLEKIVELAATAQKTHYFLNGLTAEPKLGTVVEALVFKTKQILDRFTAELSDLQLICLFQSGQINQGQLRLQSGSKLAGHTHLPLTLMRFYELVEGELFVKVQTVYDVVSNGVMDFLVAQKDQRAHHHQHFAMRMFQDQQASQGQPGEKAG